MTVHLYEVGGHVRDSLMGVKSKDIDFAVEADSYEAMRDWIADNRFHIWSVKPLYQTIRAQFPKNDPRQGLTADFVLCRKDGEYTDGRRPDSVTPGTIFDDLARRDFTVNAMARDLETGELIDPWGGKGDLNLRRLRAVGNAKERLLEDSLRALRAIRFSVTKGFVMDREMWDALADREVIFALRNVSRERMREELVKAFRADTVMTLLMLKSLPDDFTDAIFRDGLRLDATLAS